MSWSTPKTDWYGTVDANGVYSGDRFNAEDFNRIKNNLQSLRDLAVKIYDEFDIGSVGEDIFTHYRSSDFGKLLRHFRAGCERTQLLRVEIS